MLVIGKNEDAVYKKQLTELRNRKESLTERFVFGDIEKDMYTKFLSQAEEKIANLKAKYAIPEIDLSNIKTNLNKAIDFSQNVSKHWVSGNVDHKQSIQKMMFPEGIGIDTEKRQYLTLKANALFSAKRVFTRDTKDNKKEIPTENVGDSCLVAGVLLLSACGGSRVQEGDALLLEAHTRYARMTILFPTTYKSKLLTYGE